MIIGKISPGSGLGDQLFSYITTRTIALDKGYDFGFVGKEFFKGKDFMNLDWGMGINLKYHIEQPAGKLIISNNDPQPRYWWNKLWEAPSYYDPEVNFIEDGTVIDGSSAQDERYWDINKVREWLKVEPLEMPDDLCVINFRGGEFASNPDLFLTKEYWDEVIQIMKDKGINKFQVHTDDPNLVYDFFDFPIVKNISENWRSIRYAKHLILSNSAFGILPALLNENVKEVIAPFGWNARNASLTKWMGRSMNYYKKFIYI